jgi:hypothetical protein
MSSLGLLRRAAIATCGALPLLAVVTRENALAQSHSPVRAIQVDVAPLRANVGDPTASWVEQGLPAQLSQALAGRMTPQRGALIVRIDFVTLGPNKDGWAQDNISGVATIGGIQRPVRAINRYQASAVDQAMVQDANHRRVTLLLQALSYWLARDL